MDPFILENYRRYLVSTGRTKSVRSIRDYLLSLAMFEREAGSNFLEVIKDYRDFHWIIESLGDRTAWPDGRLKKVWSLRMKKKVADECTVFFRWAYQFKFTPHNPLKDGNQFRRYDSKPPEFFEWDSDEFRKLFQHPSNSNRDIAILHILRASGIRISECAHLTIGDINLVDGLVRIRNGKGGKDGFAPLDAQARDILANYISALKAMAKNPYKDLDPLFPAFVRTKKFMLADSIRKLIYDRGNDLGIHAYPHKLRHSLAAELLDRGADLLEIAEILRHKDINTTRRYTHLKPVRMKKIYDRLLARSA